MAMDRTRHEIDSFRESPHVGDCPPSRESSEEGVLLKRVNSKETLIERPPKLLSDEDGSCADLGGPAVVKKKQLSKESQVIVRRWMARHDQVRKTDCGIAGEDPAKNWEELMWDLGYKGKVPLDVDTKYRTYVRNEGNRLEKKGVFEKTQVFNEEGRLINREKRIWKPWTEYWERKDWNGNIAAPEFTVDGLMVSIRPIISVMSYTERNTLVKYILDVNECAPAKLSEQMGRKRWAPEEHQEDRLASHCLLTLSGSTTGEKRRRIGMPTT